MTYRVELTRRARRSLSDELPEVVAAACWEFIRGPLAEDFHRVGKRLRGVLADGWSARRVWTDAGPEQVEIVDYH